MTITDVLPAQLVPPAPRPYWAETGPDTEGACDGPSFLLPRVDLSVSTGWTPQDGPTLWMDTLLYRGGDLTPAEARRLAAALNTAADLVEGAL